MKAGANSKKGLKEEAWRRGHLRWKLDETQRKIYDQIKSHNGGSFYFNKARRVGGSYLLLVMAIEKCLLKPHAQVKYAAPTAKSVRKIILPNIRKILTDCPDDLRPKWSLLDNEWRFPNGACLSLAGCDNQQYESLRGTEADFVCMDEVGFMDELDYVLNDVLMPQVQDTDGMIVLASTPPRSPAHQSFKIAMAHRESGRYYHATVWDNARRSKEQHDRFFRQMAQAKGMELEEFYQSVTFRREYLGEFVTDEERSVIPEWNAALEKHLTKPIPPMKLSDKYVSLDVGWRDGMAALFAYWDHRNARLIIVDEYLAFKKTTDQVVHAIKTKELELWSDEKPFLRISDNNLQFIADLNSKGLTFIPTQKHDKELQINTVREWIRGYKIFINPRCKRLISQLGSTIWNKQRTSYERNSEGHGDLLDALVYLVRNVRRGRRPTDPKTEDGPDIFRYMLEAERNEAHEQKIVDHFAAFDWTSNLQVN